MTYTADWEFKLIKPVWNNNLVIYSKAEYIQRGFSSVPLIITYVLRDDMDKNIHRRTIFYGKTENNLNNLHVHQQINKMSYRYSLQVTQYILLKGIHYTYVHG